MDEVAVGTCDGELGDEGAVDEISDGDRFEGRAESGDGRCEQVDQASPDAPRRRGIRVA